METTARINVAKLKSEIKTLVEEQKFYKDQRKTVHNKLERKVDPWDAAIKHENNRIDLSIMYAVLLVLKGFSIDEAAKAHISKKCEDWVYNHNKGEIQKVLDSYKIKED